MTSSMSIEMWCLPWLRSIERLSVRTDDMFFLLLNSTTWYLIICASIVVCPDAGNNDQPCLLYFPNSRHWFAWMLFDWDNRNINSRGGPVEPILYMHSLPNPWADVRRVYSIFRPRGCLLPYFINKKLLWPSRDTLAVMYGITNVFHYPISHKHPLKM